MWGRGGRGHLAPGPAGWRQAALPRVRRPRPAPPRGAGAPARRHSWTQARRPSCPGTSASPLRPPRCLLPPGPGGTAVRPPETQERATRLDSGGCRVQVVVHRPPTSRHRHSPAGTPSGRRAPLAPSPLTHRPRGKGARRLSGCRSCSGRNRRAAVGSSCRAAGSCQG